MTKAHPSPDSEGTGTTPPAKKQNLNPTPPGMKGHDDAVWDFSELEVQLVAAAAHASSSESAGSVDQPPQDLLKEEMQQSISDMKNNDQLDLGTAQGIYRLNDLLLRIHGKCLEGKRRNVRIMIPVSLLYVALDSGCLKVKDDEARQVDSDTANKGLKLQRIFDKNFKQFILCMLGYQVTAT